MLSIFTVFRNVLHFVKEDAGNSEYIVFNVTIIQLQLAISYHTIFFKAVQCTVNVTKM